MNEPLNNDQDIDQCSMDSYDSDDDDCIFIDNMLEENVDIEAIKRCEQVKRKLDDLDVEDQNQQITVTNNNNTLVTRVPTKTEITHFSGMPIYLDKRSRVCTLSKPYYLGSGSARKHHIPLSAIPCLQYRNELEKERKAREEMELKCLNNNNDNVETLEENKKERSLDSIKIREYCRRLFEFKTITVKKFTNWADRRKHEQLKKIAQRPSLPESTKLITCTIPKIIPNNNNSTAGTAAQNLVSKPFKKDICILHEYVQHTERTQPKYIFEELENFFINDMEYGKGYGSSKKEAKTEADQRVSELCLKAGQYSPYQILVECIKRLYGFEDLDIKTDTKIVKHHKIEFKMTAGTHEAIVICKNKREEEMLKLHDENGKQQQQQQQLSLPAILNATVVGQCGKNVKNRKEKFQRSSQNL
ncbi:Microprocessor complex subunit dgcr8 [Dermatophagoides pteronyssinus]|uniref:Microprocessor complex subunit dgcr8 n=1 Tax=Dermatophagoides pteronyssinus TaxID=6956 RepID=A0ABQ8IUQ0_DERPT|nr:Microprocessor complex subunit dgcr8 [Dermatophagoides pteronyssinus]